MYLLIQLLNFIVELKDLKWDDAKHSVDNKKYIVVFVSTRAYKPVIEINSMNFVGGRIVDLKSVADKFHEGQSFEDIKKEIVDAKLLQNYKHYEMGKRIISALSKELDRTTFERFFDEPEEANEVLETNVFAYHPEKDT
ncbi:hypothetical protein RhiirA5_397121 [Rhizophagus irregularis]|uniref:Uncharacterized protein n=1 Tax=Rhizophagus irregularis TaxID=588596 RepID=A0A2I1EYU1_9GLOM|nr:hypothetical protein RhiirA5_397121 [Rhizophagus irregularis]PKC67202.1 hypothetical protein RhiirA1_441312 [Rhizophagus irregularis]PKY27290.1 hypothetical protein RhiirB3_473409 [Rhizophagus irregularis]